MTMRRILIAGLAVCALAIPTNARGADPAQVQEGHALFDEGVQLMDRKDYEHARVKFLAANSLVKSSTNLWNLGYCEVRSGHYVEGVRHLRQYIRNPAAEPDDVKFANSDLLPQALAKIGQLQIDAHEGVVVTLDGKDALGTGPFLDPIAVAAGPHHVEARLGAQHVEQDVQVGVGQVVAVRVLPAADAAPPATATATVPIAALDLTPSEPPPAAVGLTTGRKVAIGLGVAAVAVAGVGIGFGVAANSSSNNADSLSSGNADNSCTGASTPRCTSLQSASSAARSEEIAATGLYIGGGALAIGALVAWFLSPPRSARTGLVVVPILDRAGTGVSLAGHF